MLIMGFITLIPIFRARTVHIENMANNDKHNIIFFSKIVFVFDKIFVTDNFWQS
jgi:hypothetical protein